MGTFFRSSTDRIKTDIGKEYSRNALHHPGESVRHKRVPVTGIHIKATYSDHKEDHQYFQTHHEVSTALTLLYPQIGQVSNQHYDNKSRQIKDHRYTGYMRGSSYNFRSSAVVVTGQPGWQ